jgi:hypothetical protein
MSLDLQAKDRFFGQTIMEYIQMVPGELPVDAVGLWQIVAAGQEWFGLRDDDLIEFVHRSVFALLTHGARPVIGGGGTKHDWILQSQYGETNEEILDTVVKEWLAEDCDPYGLWFALPSQHVGNNFFD